MQQAIPETFSREEWVTPDIAKTYLEANTRNRNLRKPYVAQLAQAIESGNFLPCVGSISFDIDGRLIDGQHRLSAIVMADSPVKLIVVRNASPEAQAVIDTGVKRLSADVLKIKDVPYASNVAAAIRLLAELEKDTDTDFSGSRLSMSPRETSEFFNQHPDIVNSASATSRMRFLAPISVLAFAHYVLGRTNSMDRDLFFSKLDTPDNLNADSPIMVLRDVLTRMMATKRTMRPDAQQRQIIALIFQAWNLWRAGKTVTRIKIPAKFPKPL
jgi:hypothetical protein